MTPSNGSASSPVEAHDLLRLAFLSQVRFAPDGSLAAYACHRVNQEDDRYVGAIWLFQPEDGSVRELTAPVEGLGFTWLDDCKHLLFWGVRGQKDRQRRETGEQFTQCYRIPVDGGEARPAFRLPFTANSIRQVGPGDFLLTGLYEPTEESLREVENDEERKKRREREQACVVLEELPFWSNGAGFVSGKRTRLYRFREDGKEPSALTDIDVNVQSFEYDDENHAVVCVIRPIPGVMPVEDRILILDLRTGEAREVPFDRPMNVAYACPAGDQAILYVASDMSRYGLNENRRMYRYDRDAGSHRCLNEGEDVCVGSSVNSDCRFYPGPRFRRKSHTLLYLTTEGSNSYLNRMSREGAQERLVAGAGSVDDFDTHGDTTLMVALRSGEPQEVYIVRNGDERRVTSHNAWLSAERALRRAEPTEVGGEAVPTLSGWVMLPHGYDPNRSYPGILQIHGGPKTAYGDVFFHEMQYLAGAGYVVFYCNPRGSDGRGNDFADIRGRYGTVDFEDLMRFTDAVLERYPAIDRERVGVAGGSYGGFMTNWIIGHTKRFRAAVSQRSIADWQSFFGTTDIGYYFAPDQIAATPWDAPERLAEQSPLTYAGAVETPTLFVHSDQDYRCWMAEALRMFTALRLRGIDTRLCLFRGENHELSRSGKPSQRERRLEEIRSWFDEHLKPRP